MGFGSLFPRFLTMATKPHYCEPLRPATGERGPWNRAEGAVEQSCAGVCVLPGWVFSSGAVFCSSLCTRLSSILQSVSHQAPGYLSVQSS